LRENKDLNGNHGAMRFNLRKGNKGNNDLVLDVATDGWEQLSYQDLFKLIKLLYVNEDKIYPPPNKGSKMLLEALDFLREHSVEETTATFQIKK